jgi:hypothetical protein
LGFSYAAITTQADNATAENPFNLSAHATLAAIGK